MLARTGSLARIDARLLRVLPKVITPPTGRPAFSRYACVQGPGIDARWHKIPARHRGTDLRSEYATLLLLPWPLRVQASDFHPVGPVQRPAKNPYGFFEFAPAEGLDLDLLDRVLVAARQEAGSVDVVLLPESAVAEGEIDDLETLLDGHGVIQLVAGVRQPTRQPGQFPNNWLHMGFNPRLEKGGLLPQRGAPTVVSHPPEQAPPLVAGRRPGRAVPPRRRPAPPHPLVGSHGRTPQGHPVRRGGRTGADLAGVRGPGPQRRHRPAHPLGRPHGGHEHAAGRAAAPLPLDGPLRQRPGRRSRLGRADADLLRDGRALPTPGREASRVIALWKDPTRGVREIPLEPGAHGVLLTVCMDRATRYSADLRWPVDNSTSCYGVAVRQVRAASAGSPPPPSPSTTSTTPVLELDELTILTAWAEGVSEAAAYAPERIDLLLAAAGPGAHLASRAGPPRAIPPTRRRHRIARPIGPSGPHTSRRVVIRRLAHRSQRGSPRRNNPRPSGPARFALHARGTAHQATNPSQ